MSLWKFIKKYPDAMLLLGDVDDAMFKDFCNYLSENETMITKRGCLNIILNSGGGSSIYFLSIMNALQSMSTTIRTYNAGLCGSAAFDIYMMGDERYSDKNAYFMLHKDTIENPVTATNIDFCKKLLRVSDDVYYRYCDKLILTPEQDALFENGGDVYFNNNDAKRACIINK